MKIEQLTEQVSISDQITYQDLNVLKQQGVELIVCNRPDGEAKDQPTFAEIKTAAQALGLSAVQIAYAAASASELQITEFAELLGKHKKIHAYCRTGNRSKKIFAASNNTENQTGNQSNTASSNVKTSSAEMRFDVVIVGAGSGGIATASSLQKRNQYLRIALVDPAESHFYQPGWTMVGGGVFDAKTTKRTTQSIIPSGIEWLKKSVVTFHPEENCVVLSDSSKVHYDHLVVAPGLKLNWSGIEGLEESLGQHGVTSNYRYDLAPYTWNLVKNMTSGRALFTQPPMPIKCAGAPQKALYLSASEWLRTNRLKNIDIEFYNAGGVLFGVEAYVPALMEYIEKYQADLHFMHTLVKVDGPAQTAWFKQQKDGEEVIVEKRFDFLHVCPPQCAPDFVRESPLADDAGWLDVHPDSLQHTQFNNIWGVGDVLNTPNAKTMAAARKQAPVVAQNIVNAIQARPEKAIYDGYGSCPLTVENGKIVLAEFGYGGKLIPTFPSWLNQGTKPTKLAWLLKAKMLPYIYWNGMLKGREWLASPKQVS